MSILEVKDLKVSFNTVMGKVEAVKGVDLSVNSGEVLGIIGESGSGKSVTSLAIMGLIDNRSGAVESGEILFEGKNLINLTEKGAIISLLSFHSLEDRLAKQFLKKYSSNCRCDKTTPICKCGGKMLELINKKPIMATDEEIKQNPPSRSAKLRIFEKA